MLSKYLIAPLAFTTAKRSKHDSSLTSLLTIQADDYMTDWFKDSMTRVIPHADDVRDSEEFADVGDRAGEWLYSDEWWAYSKVADEYTESLEG